MLSADAAVFKAAQKFLAENRDTEQSSALGGLLKELRRLVPDGGKVETIKARHDKTQAAMIR